MKKAKNIFLILFGTLVGSAFMTFMAKNKGKDLRKEVLEAWENGEKPAHAKWRVFLREFMGAIRDIGSAFDEVMASPKMKSEIKAGKKKFQDVKKNVEKHAKEGVDELKKKFDETREIASEKIHQMRKK